MLFSIISLMNNYLELKNAKYLKECNEPNLVSKSLNPQLGEESLSSISKKEVKDAIKCKST